MFQPDLAGDGVVIRAEAVIGGGAAHRPAFGEIDLRAAFETAGEVVWREGGCCSKQRVLVEVPHAVNCHLRFVERETTERHVFSVSYL